MSEDAFKVTAFLILAVVLIFGSYTCCGVSDSVFERQLRQEGVTQAVNDGHSIWACSKSDTFNTEFHGIRNGQKVSGVICGGPLKGYTVRYY